MKAYCAALGAFAGLAFAQNSSTTPEPTVDYAVDQCSQSAFNACPADGRVAHRCLKIERASDGVLADQCVSKCAADSPCLSKCGQGTGTAWCDASGGCHCDRGWNSAKVAPTDPEDLSWVKKWAAVGDSYSAGIGSGSPYPGSPEDCARYDQSYPAYMQSHELMPQDPPAAFEFLSCSGATAPAVLDNQVAAMGTGYDVITVSAGGNDVGLTDVLNACIFQWNPFTSCKDTLSQTSALVRDVLPGNLDRLYAALRDKISPGRKIYVTGYATFFDNTTTACDDVSWGFWYNFGNKQHLTTERRTFLNELVLSTNEVIQAAVQRAGDAFEYVGYNQYFSVLQGRFCEAGVKEPDVNRNGLLFFQKGTDTSDSTLFGRRDLEDPEVGTRAAALQSRQITDRGGKNRTEVSFERYITDSIAEARAQDASLVASEPDSSAGDPALKVSVKAQVGNLIGDDLLRVFHPRPAGHAIIANLVLWRMTQGTVAAQNSPGNATEAAGCAIPLPNAPTMPGAVPGAVPDCQAAAQACLSCLGGASGAGVSDCNFRFHSDCNACGGGDGCPC